MQIEMVKTDQSEMLGRNASVIFEPSSTMQSGHSIINSRRGASAFTDGGSGATSPRMVRL